MPARISRAMMIISSLILLNGCSHSINDYYASPEAIQEIGDSYNKEYKENITLNKNLVKLVDFNATTGNFLFRGNSPVSKDTFEYDALKSYLSDAASPIKLPTQFTIIDVSLLNKISPKDRDTLAVEHKFWDQNKDKGSLINHAIFGNITSPDDYSVEKRKILEKLPSIDRLDELVVQLHTLMSQNLQNNPSLIYVHCEAGKDRTGEVIAAYSMKYQGVSYNNAIKNAHDVAGRNLSRFSENAIKWYAWYLKDIEKSSTVGPVE